MRIGDAVEQHQAVHRLGSRAVDPHGEGKGDAAAEGVADDGQMRELLARNERLEQGRGLRQ